MNVERLNDLLKHEIRDLYSGEKQILDHLPDLIERASDPELKKALRQHHEETERQMKRLEEAASAMDLDPSGETCKGIAGIISEGSELVEDLTDDDQVRDAAIVGAAQRVEHYEIAGYGTAITYARMLGHDDVARHLRESLKEEKSADETLTRIAEDHVNRRAMATA